MDSINVGIIVIVKPEESVWKNGILQNCVYFYNLLEKIPFINEVKFLQCSDEDMFKEKPFPLKDYKYEFLNDNTIKKVKEEYRLLFSLGAIPPDNIVIDYKENKHNKFVQYKGGNEFMNTIESILYGQYLGWPNVKLKQHKYTPIPCDEVWIVPQQEHHNLSYSTIKHKADTRVVPFVWDSQFIDDAANNLANDEINNPGCSLDFHKKDFSNGWNWVSFEPNMSVLKNMVPIIYTCEYFWQTSDNRSNIDKFMMTNASGHMENESLKQMVYGLDIFKDKKITFESRYSTPYMLWRFGHAVISHQWGNALNYAYLDACHFGIPLVHNAHLCKDLGYYYEEWDLIGAAKLMEQVMNSHMKNVGYRDHQRAILKRYTIENEMMIEQYDMLIRNLFNKNMFHDMRKYNYHNNLMS